MRSNNSELRNYLLLKILPLTYHSQLTGYATLPRFPVPPLRQTLNRFLAIAKPLVDNKQYEETIKLVDDFGIPNGEGEQLQKLLEQRAEQTDNWLSDYWLRAAYLEQRCPVVVNVSPGLSFPVQDFEGIEGQISFASRLMMGLLQYKRLIDMNLLPADTDGSGRPMDMGQYLRLFSVCRIPGVKHDTLRFPYVNKPVHHCIVACKGHFFAVDIVDQNGVPLNELQMAQQLKLVVAQAKSASTQPVGILTTENRSTWGKAHRRMKESIKNCNSLDAIESSLFLLCIDQPVEIKKGAKNEKLNRMARQLLHGGGSNQNTANRWFDKTLQFVVGYDGLCGLTYEHSPAEGPPVAALMDNTMDYVFSNKQGEEAGGAYKPPRKLEFDLDSDTLFDIKQAEKNVDVLVDDVDVVILPFAKFGKVFIKSQKLSPDSFVQMALQLTYNKLHGCSPPTYETGTLRRFKEGRTDTIRLPLEQSDAFVRAMLDRNESSNRRVDLLRKAVHAHKEYTAAACSGNGIDRHLLGLHLIAVEHGYNVPRLMMGSAYSTAMHFKLSTSQVPTRHDACMMFGPVYPDCYGCCYNPQSNNINFSISAFNSCPETDSDKFATALEESLMDMHKIFAETQKAHL